jgi:hypothetical protein
MQFMDIVMMRSSLARRSVPNNGITRRVNSDESILSMESDR